MSVSTERHDGNTEKQSGHVAEQLTGSHLSTRQLIIRRGLAVFAVVALLAVGASVHFLVPLPETHSAKGNLTEDWINTTYAPDPIFSTAQ